MSEKPPQLRKKLKELVSEIMKESDPLRYDALCADIWRVLDELESHDKAGRLIPAVSELASSTSQ